ncbi:uncharacterized protein LOC128735722 [Sabethes cyaneus]|uniref:uncharacterized protein LOC128735722 n=1 Tax=Sabethes cyaneus TaxID=53552 RepID=UPI00237ED8FC|nr:uncharacterized protein LOC128735722 [Sabethes cyaneus]
MCMNLEDGTPVPNPFDCNKFFVCKDGMISDSEEGVCPANYYFNPKTGECDFPENVDCGDAAAPTETTETESPTTSSTSSATSSTPVPSEECPDVDSDEPVFLPVVNECNAYILCYQKKKHIYKCLENLYWNNDKKQCDLASNVNCQAMSEDPYGCPREGVEFLPHTDDCKKYVYCRDGISRVQSCAFFHVYDKEQKMCVIVPVCKCLTSKMSEISILRILLLIGVLFVSRSEQQRNRCLGVPDGRFINDFTECESYFVCTRNSMVRGRCPSGYYFSEEGQKCDFPWNVTCLLCRWLDGNGDDGNGDGGNELPENFPIARECRKYTACADDEGFLMECSPDLMFNPDPAVRACDTPSDDICIESVCPNNVNPSVPTFVPDLLDCSRYHICYNWTEVAISQSCAGDLLFNPITRQCDLPENVDCDHILPLPPTSCRPTGIHYIPADDCFTYYICVNGEQQEPAQTCLGGTIFDIITMTCRNPVEGVTECIDDNSGLFKAIFNIPYHN